MADDLHNEELEEVGAFINQPSKLPVPKVAAGGIGGAVAVVLIWVGGLYGMEVPSEVAASITAILGFVASYFVKNKEII